jgi:hypothetical protein
MPAAYACYGANSEDAPASVKPKIEREDEVELGQ